MKKNKIYKNNILILIFSSIFIIFGLIFIFFYLNINNEIKEITGTIKNFSYETKHWSDYLGSSGPCLNIRLEDGDFFKATGLVYDNINIDLFSELKEGTLITIISDRNEKMVGIQYNNIVYLDYNEVIEDMKYNDKVANIFGFSLIVATVISSSILLYLNNKRIKEGIYEG